MKRLFLATIALFLIAAGTFWFMGKDLQYGTETLKKINVISRFKDFKVVAEKGDAAAQYKIATMLESGKGTRKDVRQSVQWYMKAAEQGHSDAQFKIGWMYANGIGLRQDFAAAAKWYRLAATFNQNPDAQFRLGELHFNGRGVENDYAKAIKYYTMAGTQGHAASQYLLGSMYVEGWGVKRDLIVAYMWLKMAVPNTADAIAINKKYDPQKKLLQVTTKMNKFQVGEAEKRLNELEKRR